MTEAMDNLAQTKAALRRAALEARRSLSRASRHDVDGAILERLLALPTVKEARSVFTYISVAEEIDTRHFIAWSRRHGKQVTVPHITRGAPMRRAPFVGWAELRLEALGIPAAPPANVDDVCAVAIVPGLLFTATGHRLGYGGGYYDCWLAANPHVTSIGLCRESGMRKELPLEPFDVPVDYVITETRTITVARATTLD